jgi:DNA processing protein
MVQEALQAYLQLSLVPRMGVKKLSRLLAHGAAEHIVNYSSSQLLALGLQETQIAVLRKEAKYKAESGMRWLALAADHHIIHFNSPFYPLLLKEIPSPPAVLFVQGRLEALNDPQLAIVGSRNASLSGQKTARQFAQDLVKSGLIITSGLALGIDGYAHDGALTAGGETIAVLGSGLEHIYPSKHRGLAERVRACGALVSEFVPETKPRAEFFPRRNRIISGLSAGVLVVEAAEKSGSLITARYAAEQGRDVFVIPGAISAANRGSNQLIRQGASLVQSSEEVLEEITILLNWTLTQPLHRQTEIFPQLIVEEELPFTELLANVGAEATPVDILASRTNIPVQDVMMQLLELELLGHVVAVNGGYIRKGRG